MNTNTLTSVEVLAGLPGIKGLYQPVKVHGFQGYSKVHGLLPYREATVLIKMHLLENHEVRKYLPCWLWPFGRTGG